MKKILLTICLFLISVPAFAQFNIPTEAPQEKYTYISTGATTVVKASPGSLHNITVTGGTAGTIIVYDNASGAGATIANFDSTNAIATYTFDVNFSSGCTVVTGGATKLTVSFI